MSSRWRERKGTVVSSAELQARRKALLAPVQKYRRAWVQVSAESSYKVLKWVPSSSVISTNAENSSAQGERVISFFVDPNSIDDTTDEEDDEEEEEEEDDDEEDEEDDDDDDDGEGEVLEMDIDPSQTNSVLAEQSGLTKDPKGLKKQRINRKTSKVMEETQGVGGQLAGLETGEIAEQIEIDEDEDESDHDEASENVKQVIINLETKPLTVPGGISPATRENSNQPENLTSIFRTHAQSNGSNSHDTNQVTPYDSKAQPTNDLTMDLTPNRAQIANTLETTDSQDYPVPQLLIPDSSFLTVATSSSIKEDKERDERSIVPEVLQGSPSNDASPPPQNLGNDHTQLEVSEATNFAQVFENGELNPAPELEDLKQAQMKDSDNKNIVENEEENLMSNDSINQTAL
ncbi:hypothetical protein BY996DRAFT_6791670 [Phakopsora pachyrhizi]|nr:hypothetical protein BY996DRAFT_6791670 [Phakopsora pachyrhizi]